MKRTSLAVLVACSIAVPALAQDNPFSGLKGRIKEGQWEYTMQMEGVPGMPAGMKMPSFTFSHCITPQDVEKGGFAHKEGKMPEGCSVSNMKVTAGGASWTMECTKDPKMKVDTVMTGTPESFTMKQAMQMNQGGQMMVMNQTMSGRYSGPCKR